MRRARLGAAAIAVTLGLLTAGCAGGTTTPGAASSSRAIVDKIDAPIPHLMVSVSVGEARDLGAQLLCHRRELRDGRP